MQTQLRHGRSSAAFSRSARRSVCRTTPCSASLFRDFVELQSASLPSLTLTDGSVAVAVAAFQNAWTTALTGLTDQLRLPLLTTQVVNTFTTQFDVNGSWLEEVNIALSRAAAKTTAEPGLVAVLLASAGAAGLLVAGSGSSAPSATTLTCVYDPAQAAAYFAARPSQKLRRQLELLSDGGAFAAALLADWAGGRLQSEAPARAAALRELIVKQGAAFIKVGQALAVRPDVLPPAYVAELAKLLDQVPPLERVAAAAALRDALGSPEAVFEDMSAFDSPVAAASIGQVYKAVLRDGGRTVAVKLQRPGILESVSLDLLLMRGAVSQLTAMPRGAPGSFSSRLGVQAAAFLEVLDLAATRFLEELDYESEARNSVRFAQLMAAAPSVSDAILVPAVVGPLSSRTVLVQEWVEGTRLADIDKGTAAGRAQAAAVVRTLLLSYMAQLLETGFLHADPHPGNFLLLSDGRLAILDYGMMTTITEDQRIAFVEYMAHLSSKQYSETVDDLVNLGFIDAELSRDPVKRAIIAPAIASTLEVIYGSGGGLTPDKVVALRQQSRVAALSDELKAISRMYPIRLPPYFLLILRAFGTLEGLGLGVEGDFQILQECFPFVARKLLTDDSPRIRAALRSFAYGAGGERLSLERVEMMAEGLRSFSSTMDGASRSAGAQLALSASASASASVASAPAAAPALDAGSLQLLQVLLSPQGNYVQTLLLDELVRAVDALSREAFLALLAAGPLRALVQPPAGAFSLLSPLPFPFPFPFLPAPAAQLSLSASDIETLATIRRLASLARPVAPAPAPASAPADADAARALQAAGAELRALAEAGQRLSPHAQALAPGLARLGERFAALLAARLVARATEDLNAALGRSALQGAPTRR